MASRRLMLLAVLLALTDANTLHQHMSTAELRQVFHVDSHDLVPEYEIVHVHHHAAEQSQPSRDSASYSDRTESSDSDSVPISPAKQEAVKHLTLSAFGNEMKLKMKKATGLFKGEKLKMWMVDKNVTQPHQVEYTEQPEDDEDIGEIYQDEENMAALLMLQDKQDGSMAVEGTIGHELVVKPVPSALRRRLTSADDDELFLDDAGESVDDDVTMDTGRPMRSARSKRAATQPRQHIVYKRSMARAEEDMGSDYAFMEPDHLSKKHRTKRSITKREAPYVIYPEILVIVDYDGYRLHGGDNVQIKRYFVSFWNGVDLRYKLLKGPKIRISIAGIIISRGRDATPYLERNRVGRDAIDSAAALTDMGKYLFRERRLPVYDIAVAVTKLDMCRRQYANDACNRGTAGFAYVGGACVVNKRLEKVNSVAIIEDTGGFSGIIVGAHEVGHLLGAVHDGSPPPSYLGGPGAEKCRWEDGFIMSDLRHTDKGFKWSPCSVISFHHFLNGDTATCLYNSPHEDESLPRVLPGKLLSLDAQCRKDRGTSACFKDDRVCAQLFCFDAGSGYCVAYRPAAEGSSCGDGQYCINGRCTTEHENIIPDYSQNTPTYIRHQDLVNGAATEPRPVFVNLTTQRTTWDNEHKTTKAITVTKPPPSYTASPKVYSFKVNLYTATTKLTTTTPPPIQSPVTEASTPYPPTTANPYYKYKYHNELTTKAPYKYYNNVISTTKNPYDFSNFHQTYSKGFQKIAEIAVPKAINLKYTTVPPTTTPSTKITYKPTTENPYYKYFRDLTSTKEPEIVVVTKDESYNNYNQYTTTTNRYSSAQNTYKSTVPPSYYQTSTQNPYSYKSTAPPTYHTSSPYAYKSTAPPTYHTSSPYAYKSTAPPTYHTSTQEVRKVTGNGANADGTECVDIVANLSGSMSCPDFLLRYGYQYCPSSYMRRNCCATHRDVCLNKTS